MRKSLYILLAFCLLLPVGTISIGAVGRRDVTNTIADLERRAAEGDSSALYHLSTLYERGYDSIAADSAKALRLLKASAKGGFAPAQNYLGYLYQSDPRFEANRDSAVYWLEKAASQGDPKAASNLGYLLLGKKDVPDSVAAKAAEWFERAAEAGMAMGKAQLAELYAEGLGVPRDTLKAEKLFMEAIRDGFTSAEEPLYALMSSDYGRLKGQAALEKGVEMARNGATGIAFILYNQAAEDSIPKAYTLLGDAYAGAKGVDYNNALAIDNYMRGAVAGDPSAQFILAELLEIFPDILESRIEKEPSEESDDSVEMFNSPQYWYGRAAEGGVKDARTAVSRLFDDE